MTYALASGAVSALSIVVTVAFLRSYVRTRDRFFIYFAAAFFTFGIAQLALGVTNTPELNRPLAYLPRLAGYLLILAAIWDKNRSTRVRLTIVPSTNSQSHQRRRAAR